MEIRMMRFDFYDGRLLVNRRAAAAAILEPGERVSEAIRAAGEAYCERYGVGDMYAWTRTIPAGAEEYVDVEFRGGRAMLVQAAWVPAGWVVVGRGGDAVVPAQDVGKQMPYAVMEAV